MSDLTEAVEEIGEHLPCYKEAAGFYDGTVGEVFSSPLIKKLIGQSAKAYRVNLARRVVDAVNDRLKIASISVPDDDAATERLTEIWDRNKLGLLVKKVHRDVLTEGDYYAIVWPDDDDDTQVAIHLHGPEGMRVFYDEENPHKKRYAAKVWLVGPSGKQQTRVNLLYADRIERYITKPGMDGTEDKHFERFTDDDGAAWPIPNPFEQIPVFHFRTDEPYGRPEHRDAFGPQLAITKLVATHMSSADFQGFPQRYRLRATTISDAPHVGYPEEFDTPGPRHVERDRLEGGPGTVWDLSDTASVGSFPAADAKNFLEPINFYARIMGASTATPLRFMDPSGDVPSGESLRADDAPLTEKIMDRQVWLGDTWRELAVFALKVAGVEVATVKVSWKPVQQTEDLAGWQTTKAKIDAGVPQEVALEEAGYRSEEVDAWSDGAETTNLATRIDMLTKIGAAMQGLGAAVSLGVLSEQQVQQIVSELLEDATEEDTPDAA